MYNLGDLFVVELPFIFNDEVFRRQINSRYLGFFYDLPKILKFVWKALRHFRIRIIIYKIYKNKKYCGKK